VTCRESDLTRRNVVGARIVAFVAAAGCALTVVVTPAYAKGCGYAGGYYVSANGHTSCPFARNVARRFASGSYHPTVYSPVTGRSYRMNCYRRSARSYACSGGNNAYVRLTY
jgi:hypothetical protein